MKSKVCQVRYKLTGAHAFYKKDQNSAIAYVGTEAIRLQTYTFHDVELEAIFLVVADYDTYDSTAEEVLSIHKSYETAETYMFELKAAHARDRHCDEPQDTEWSIKIEELKP